MAKGEGLVYYKWYFDKTRELEGFVNDGLLTLEQAAEIFFAVQAYAEKGEVREMSSPALRMTYKSLCTDADRAKQAYGQKVEKLQDSGKKGGKAKAANAAAKVAEDPPDPEPETDEPEDFSFPPTFQQFRSKVDRINKTEWDNKAKYSDNEVESLFTELKGAGWSWQGRPVQSLKDFELLITWRFSLRKMSGISEWDIMQRWAELRDFTNTIEGLNNTISHFWVEGYKGDVFHDMETYINRQKAWSKQIEAGGGYVPGKIYADQERSGPT